MPSSTSLAATAEHKEISLTIPGCAAARHLFRRASLMFNVRWPNRAPSPLKRRRLAYFICHTSASASLAAGLPATDAGVFAYPCRGSRLPEPFAGLAPDLRRIDADVAQHVPVELGEQAPAAAGPPPMGERAGEARGEAAPLGRRREAGDGHIRDTRVVFAAVHGILHAPGGGGPSTKRKGPVHRRRGPVDLFSAERSPQTRTQRPLAEGLSRVHEDVGDGPRPSHGATRIGFAPRCQCNSGPRWGRKPGYHRPAAPSKDDASCAHGSSRWSCRPRSSMPAGTPCCATAATGCSRRR